MIFSNKVLLIYGTPCAGKYTIAKALSEKHNLYLIDNHFFNNLLFPFIDLKSNNKQNNNDLFNGILEVKKIWFEKVARYGKLDRGFVFTSVLDNSSEDKKCLQQFKNFAKKINYHFVPLKLVADEVLIKNNISNQDRKDKCKLADFNEYRKFMNTHKMMSIDNSIIIKNHDIATTITKIEKSLSG